MKNIMVIMGILLLLVGGLWILQGLNIVKGSFMTGQALWGWVGLVCVLAAVALLYTAFRDRLKR